MAVFYEVYTTVSLQRFHIEHHAQSKQLHGLYSVAWQISNTSIQIETQTRASSFQFKFLRLDSLFFFTIHKSCNNKEIIPSERVERKVGW